MRLRRRLATALAVFLASWAVVASAADDALVVRLTSPLGRTGASGAVRIVARIEAPPRTALKPIRFFIDGAPFKTYDGGPPYAVEWVDENPFERREIAVEVEDADGHVVRDTVVLEPFEILEQTDVFSVLLEATVRDGRGRFVSGLPPESFAVREDGVPQTPDLVRQEAVPATFALLIDSSQSMSRRFGFVQEAASRLLAYLRPRDRVIVAPFTKTVAALTGPTDDRDTVTRAIGAIRTGGGTAIFDCLTEIVQRIVRVDGRRVVILVTDGYDENSHVTFEETVEVVKKAQVTVYVVGIGGVAGISLRGERQLRQLATESGGRVYFPPRVEDLGAVYDQLALDAQNRYILTYTSTNQRQDGTWRTVSLVTATPGQVVQTRPGYFAPKAPPVRATIEFTVSDRQQRLLDVSREDLVVFEDGVEQAIDTFQEAVDPVQIVMALDESGSMRRVVDAVKAAAREFVMALKPDDPLALITFSDRVQFAHDLTTNRQWSLEAIEQYRALGGTALYDALHDALMRLKFASGRRAVVLLTDGRDENNPGTAPGSTHTLDDVLRRAAEVEAVVFSIGLGPNVDRAVLERLATISGGSVSFPREASELQAQYRGIVENLRRRYVLGYTSTNPARNGAWRTVEIRTRSADLRVRSRGGYFAPAR